MHALRSHTACQVDFKKPSTNRMKNHNNDDDDGSNNNNNNNRANNIK